ncbi:hypothetical protein LCGC14_2769760, partial [marine sediment metagenome]
MGDIFYYNYSWDFFGLFIQGSTNKKGEKMRVLELELKFKSEETLPQVL